MSRNGNPNLVTQKIDPDEIGYAQPDFGFDTQLSFDYFDNQSEDQDFQGTGWNKFKDCVSMFPKYERVKNYINFINQKKIQKLTELQPSLNQTTSRKKNTYSSIDSTLTSHKQQAENARAIILEKMRDLKLYKGLNKELHAKLTPVESTGQYKEPWEIRIQEMNQNVSNMQSIVDE